MEPPEESPPLLLRVRRRRTSLEEEPSVILRAEFELGDGSPDLKPSVYEVYPSEVVQAVTKHHAAGSCTNVTAPRDHLDLRPVHRGEVRSTPSAEHWFELLEERHRELVLESRAELMALIGRLRECRSYLVTPQAWKAYLKGARDEPEWRNFFEFAERGGKWRTLAGG